MQVWLERQRREDKSDRCPGGDLCDHCGESIAIQGFRGRSSLLVGLSRCQKAETLIEPPGALKGPLAQAAPRESSIRPSGVRTRCGFGGTEWGEAVTNGGRGVIVAHSSSTCLDGRSRIQWGPLLMGRRGSLMVQGEGEEVRAKPSFGEG